MYFTNLGQPSQPMVQQMRTFHEMLGQYLSNLAGTCITGRRKGEGLTSFLESNTDFLFLDNSVMSCESNKKFMIPGTNYHGNQCSFHQQPMIVTMNTNLCYPGYTQLFQYEQNPPMLYVSHFVKFENETNCFSSAKFMNVTEMCNHLFAHATMQRSGIPKVHQRAGPSVSYSIDTVAVDHILYPMSLPKYSS